MPQNLMGHRLWCNSCNLLWKEMGILSVSVALFFCENFSCRLYVSFQYVITLTLCFRLSLEKKSRLTLSPQTRWDVTLIYKKKNTHWHVYCWLSRCYHFFLNVLFWFKWRWSELKKGWKRRKGSLHSSRDSSIVENRCEFLHLFCSSSDNLLLPFFLQVFSKPFSTLSLSFAPQERWEDSCRLQDPGRLGAPSRVGAKRRLDAPQAMLTPLQLVMSGRSDRASWVPTL